MSPGPPGLYCMLLMKLPASIWLLMATLANDGIALDVDIEVAAGEQRRNLAAGIC